MTSSAPEREPPRTLYDKVWDAHAVSERSDGQTLLYIDRHFLTEGSARGFEILAERGLPMRRPERSFAVADHYVASHGPRLEDQTHPKSRATILKLEANTARHGVRAFSLGDPRQGIVHVVGPELGLSLPGMTIVCGDSHTATHGAFGALAFGIGASEVSQVLATQTLWQRKSASMLVAVDGALPAGVTAKDLILSIIARLGTSGATGHTLEYAGTAIRALSMEGRMTLCNMSIEAGARAGMIAPDEKTLAWLRGREHAPAGQRFDEASRSWLDLRTDPGAHHDRRVDLHARTIAPMVTWGVQPDQAVPVGGVVPDPRDVQTAEHSQSLQAALDYMGLRPGMAMSDLPIRHVFIGSCTNSRLEDLQAAAAIVRTRKIASGVRGLVVPGSQSVRRQAEAIGLDRVFQDAGLIWGHPGCSMCVGMNGDLVPPGEHCVSTSNRNFVGRQGPGARTHLASPATAAATAIRGRITDPREFA